MPLIIIAGREYGAGSSRDWAAKGPALLGVRAVVAESFEHIHRANLVGMGVLPLTFKAARLADLKFDGSETFDLTGVAALAPRAELNLCIRRTDGSAQAVGVAVRINTNEELAAYRQGGLLPQVYREFVAQI